MVWPEVAKAYTGLFEKACEHYEIYRNHQPQAAPALGEHSHLPPWRFNHLLRMTDSTGIYQHAIFTVPWFDHGYCADDNARALLLSVLLEGLDECPAEIGVARAAYSAFLQHAFVRDTGRFRNFMSFDRKWLEKHGSEDSHGRTLWALGAVVGRTRSESLEARWPELTWRSCRQCDFDACSACWAAAGR
jgi:hypothetical protein